MVNVLSQKAVLATLSISQWGTRRMDKEAAEEVLTKHQAERHTGLFTKRLLNKAAMEKIRSVKSAARSYHYRMTRPWLDDGARILPVTLSLDYSKHMHKLKDEFNAAVKEFARDLPKHIDLAKKELGSLFNEEDYPKSPTEVTKRFGFDILIIPCPDKDDFRCSLDKDLLSDIKGDMDKQLNSILEGALRDTGERIIDVVGHMAERLKDYKPRNGKGGKAEGTFRDSLVENVRELTSILPAFNFNDDPKFAALVKKIEKELCAHNADTLREDDTVRKAVQKSAAQILQDVSAFMA